MKKTLLLLTLMSSSAMASSGIHDICGGALFKMSTCLSFQYNKGEALSLDQKINADTICTGDIPLFGHDQNILAYELRAELGISPRVTDSYDTQEYGENNSSIYECKGEIVALEHYSCSLNYEVKENRYHGDPAPDVTLNSFSCE